MNYQNENENANALSDTHTCAAKEIIIIESEQWELKNKDEHKKSHMHSGKIKETQKTNNI